MPARPLYIPQNRGFFVGVVGHVNTIRTTYTVPAGKIARLLGGTMILQVTAVAAAFSFQMNLVLNGVILAGIANAGPITDMIVPIPPMDLVANDILLIQSTNTTGAFYGISGTFGIREYT